MGYSVVLWNIPEYGLHDGDIVPVYIRSNITHVYVIEINEQKYEIPLWKLSEPASKSKAEKLVEKYSEYKGTYSKVMLDGLPMRSDPVNNSKQVYRCRLNETVKPLYKGKGQAPTKGGNPIPGDWLRTIASDGTLGWCFSFNLKPFKTDENGLPVEEEEVAIEDTESLQFDSLLQKKWYPDSYRNMIRSKNIDIDRLNPGYNFNYDLELGKIYFTMPKINKAWEYSGAEKLLDGSYQLNGIPVKVVVKNNGFIVVRYTGEAGKPEDFNLVTIEEDLNELINNEIERREQQFAKIVKFSDSYKSGNYGSLVIIDNHKFTWNNTKSLSTNGIITSGARSTGTVTTKYFLGKNLKSKHDGVLTFKFDGMDKEVNFLYNIEETGLRLKDASRMMVKDNTISQAGSLVIFMAKVE